LNKDGIDDLALVLHENNPENFVPIITEDGTDTNPRILAILFGNKNGAYDLITQNYTVIPRYTGWSPYMHDLPVNVHIVRGTLQVSWSESKPSVESNERYTFRWQNKRFELIGYDTEGNSRSDYEWATSINFSTRTRQNTCTNGSTDDKPEKNSKQYKLAPNRKWTIDTVSTAINSESDMAEWRRQVFGDFEC